MTLVIDRKVTQVPDTPEVTSRATQPGIGNLHDVYYGGEHSAYTKACREWLDRIAWVAE